MNEPVYEKILYSVEDGVATITLNLPQFANAMDFKGVRETFDALMRAEDDENVGAVLITGAGKAFCAGFNLKEIPTVAEIEKIGIRGIKTHFRHLAHWWHQVFHRVVRIPKPVLASVNGAAAGAGLGLALCADMVVAGNSASFLCAWHSIGLANDATTSYTLVKIVGFRRAMELMLTNRTLSADEACNWEIVNRVYQDDNLSEHARSIARDLAAGPTHLQAMAKESFHMGWRRSLEEATEFEIQNVMKSLDDPYFTRALTNFLSKDSRSNVEKVRLP
ncbi:MAG: enoyl-CoA hydratase/isomerase family protein [Pseudomonadota bacterium]|nr:enoyl-CoA hydratase/isomerase family protein [Pseudomonadota bacterium]